MDEGGAVGLDAHHDAAVQGIIVGFEALVEGDDCTGAIADDGFLRSDADPDEVTIAQEHGRTVVREGPEVVRGWRGGVVPNPFAHQAPTNPSFAVLEDHLRVNLRDGAEAVDFVTFLLQDADRDVDGEGAAFPFRHFGRRVVRHAPGIDRALRHQVPQAPRVELS